MKKDWEFYAFVSFTLLESAVHMLNIAAMENYSSNLIAIEGQDNVPQQQTAQHTAMTLTKAKQSVLDAVKILGHMLEMEQNGRNN